MRNGGASFRGLSLTLSIEWQRAQLTRAKLRPLFALGDRAANSGQVLDTRMEPIIKTRIEETFVVQAPRSLMLPTVLGGPGSCLRWAMKCSSEMTGGGYVTLVGGTPRRLVAARVVGSLLGTP
jgi:hypothetical protein